MKTEINLSERIKEIDELELSASIQVKKGWCYVVICYKQQNGKTKPVWRATGVKDAPGNKKAAKNKIYGVLEKFKEELKAKVKKEYEESIKKDITPLEPQQLQIEYENQESNITEEQNNGLDEQRILKYNNMSFLAFIKESLDEFKYKVAESTYDSWYSCYSSRMTDYFRVITLMERTTMMNPDVEKPFYYNKVPKLVEITQFDIEDYIKWLFDCKLAGASADKHYELLNLVFARAIRKKIIKKENNPMTDVPKPKIDPYIADYYKPSELKMLFDIVRDDIIEVPMLFAGIYGLRRSEILGLKWDAVDFDANTFVIKHTVTKVKGCGENQIITCRDLTKSKYGYRTYPLTPELRKALIKQKMRIETNKRFFYKDKYVMQTKEYICVKENGELIKPNHLTKRFQKLALKNGMRKIRLHDIRHSTGSLLAANNVNLRQIQDFLGHGSIRSTERYSHLQFESKQNAMGVINNILYVSNAQKKYLPNSH